MRGTLPYEALIVGIAVLALSLAMVASLVWTLARCYRLGLVEDEPRCGRCGYIVHPGSRPICPECGSELLKVGVHTTATVPAIFPWPMSFAAYIFLALAAFWIGPAVARLTPSRWDFRAWRSVETSVSRSTALSREGTFGIMATGTARWWGTHLHDVRVEYLPPNYRTVLIGPGQTPLHAGHLFGPDDRYLNDDREKLRQIVSQSGFDPDSGEGLRLSGQILSAIRQLRRHEWPAESANAGVRYVPQYRSGVVEGVLFWIAGAFVVGRAIDRLHWRRRVRALERKRQLLQDLGLAA